MYNIKSLVAEISDADSVLKKAEEGKNPAELI